MKKMELIKVLSGIAIILLVQQDGAESVVASEWSLAGPTDEYVMAVINITHKNPVNGQWTQLEYGGEIGKFGVGKVAPANGLVKHVTSRSSNGEINHFGCDPLEGPFPLGPWIALIKRGSCNFDKKLEHAQAKNAIAMVVYDLEDRETLEKMGFSNCRNCSIPGIFIRKRVGEAIANITDSGIDVEMQINVGETCTRPYSGINRTSVLFVSISFIILMIISLAWLVFYYIQRFRYLHAKDRLAQRLCNAAKKALAKIPTRNVKLSDKEVSGEAECCAICIETYAAGDVLRTLPCRHEFHKTCVDPWLLEHRTCPFCKTDILRYYGFIFSGSQESILHLDLEDGNLNSSDSRDTETPIQDHPPHPVRYAELSTHNRSISNMTETPHSSISMSCPRHQESEMTEVGGVKPSLISLTVVANPHGTEVSVSTQSPNHHYSFTNCNCQCSCDKPTSTSISVPEFHPMCFVHEEEEEEEEEEVNSLEDSSSEKDEGSSCVPPSHRPLIHREDSTPLQNNPSQDPPQDPQSRNDAKKPPSRSESQHNRLEHLSNPTTSNTNDEETPPPPLPCSSTSNSSINRSTL